jgi:hypothetical protein
LGKNLKTWGTPWDHDENMLGTHGNKEKTKKKLPSPHSQNRKKWAHHELNLSLVA